MDTKRWSEQLPPEARAALDAGRSVLAPPRARSAVWKALLSELPTASSSGPATNGGLSALAVLKPFAAGLALGGVVTTGLFSALSHTGTAMPPVSSASAFQAAVPVAPAGPASDVPSPRLVTRPSASAVPVHGVGQSSAPRSSSEPSEPAPRGPAIATFPTDSPAPPAAESAVLLESRAVARARTLLQRGDARGALTELAALDRSYPQGVLVQERAALHIEALLAVGERARARDEARNFLAAHPDSPHAVAVERALRENGGG